MPGQGRPLLKRIAQTASLLFAAVSLCLGQLTVNHLQAAGRSLVREMMEDAELADVQFVDRNRGWAVGDRGVIWHTQDGGRSWKLQRSDVGCRLESIHFLSPQLGWIAGGFIHPYTHRTTGVVLRTRDGGRTWERMPKLTLPQLKKIKMATPNRGWALASPSAMYPSGLFRTSDGGRSWLPVAESDGHDWLCGDFRDAESGAAAGRLGSLAVVMQKGALRSRTPNLGLRAIHDMQLLGKGGGWLVGDGGLVMTTADGGLTWQTPPRDLPADTAPQFDFTCLAAGGNHLWVAGSPGTLIMHSPDAGRSWDAQPTGQQLPLRGLSFVDAQHGWAVGAMGTILATRDGGRTWHRQKSGGTRAAVLCVLSREEDIPLELLAQLSADEGYLSVVQVIGRRDVYDAPGQGAHAADRTRESVVAAGGSAADFAWRFPLPTDGINRDARRIVLQWDRTSDGRGMRNLQEELVRSIRQWRPEIVITHGAEPSQNDPLAFLINQQVQQAVKTAADSTALTQQLTAARLQPWQVKKVFVAEAEDHLGTVSVSTSRLGGRLGRTFSGYAAPASGLIRRKYMPPPSSLAFRLISSSLAESTAARSFFSGLSLQPGGEARRHLADPPAVNADTIRRLAQKQRNVQRLLSQDSTAQDAAWQAQIEELTRGLDGQAAGEVLFQLATRYGGNGRPELAAETHHLLANRYHGHPLTEASLIWLLHYYSSQEVATRLAGMSHMKADTRQLDHTLNRIELEDAPPSRGPRQDSRGGSFQPPRDDGPLSRRPPQNEHSELQDTPQLADAVTKRLTRAMALVELLHRRHPQLVAEPDVQLSIAAIHRQLGEIRDARRIYGTLAAARQNAPIATAAQMELWLTAPKGLPRRQVDNCIQTDQRPYLDGKLDDDAWKNAKRLRLAGRNDESAAPPATVMLAHDAEHLYVAIECKKVAGLKYQTTDQPRTRDAPLDDQDRVDLLIDTDRDYATYFRLTVDHRGWTADACNEDVSWNPAWYVASHQDDASWTVEAAIPLEQLTGKLAGRTVWAVGMQRILPGIGLQSWTQPAAVTPRGEGFGLMVVD